MADREPKVWITMNGQPVPIFEGESKADAVNRAIARNNERLREKQIAKNKEQAVQLNANNQPLPKRLKLPNIPAEDANKSSDVLHLDTGKRFRFKEGTKITQVVVFAGKGCSTPFRDAAKYGKMIGFKPEEMQHCAGMAQITDGTRTFTREVHWVQGSDGKIRKAFIKVHKKDNNLKTERGGQYVKSRS